MRQRQGSGGTIPRLLLIVALLTALLPSPVTLAQGTAVFSRIDVAGNQRIEADTIRSYAAIEPGQKNAAVRIPSRSAATHSGSAAYHRPSVELTGSLLT